MKTLAAVLTQTGKPVELLELEIPPLKTGQSLIELTYSGVCHTQLSECRGFRGEDKFLPHCLGHEGSGIVRETGNGVTKVKQGDSVVLSWIKGSGHDVPSTVYEHAGRKVNSGAIATFTKFAVISENRLSVIPKDFPMDQAALVGCAVPTGVGAIWNTANARAGQSVAVVGSGGVGLCSVAGAAAAGCYPIFAIDILDSKLVAAKKMGATHLINASTGNVLESIKAICPIGLDIVIEATGKTNIMADAMSWVRQQGGTVVVVGNARFGETITLNPGVFNQGKRLLGTWGGDNVPDLDFPKYTKMIASKKLSIAEVFSKSYRLQDINTALDDLEAGRVIRPILNLIES